MSAKRKGKATPAPVVRSPEEIRAQLISNLLGSDAIRRQAQDAMHSVRRACESLDVDAREAEHDRTDVLRGRTIGVGAWRASQTGERRERAQSALDALAGMAMASVLAADAAEALEIDLGPVVRLVDPSRTVAVLADCDLDVAMAIGYALRTQVEVL